MSEKNEAPRGKASIVRKKASPTMPSPVSAEMAAEIRDDDSDQGFDDATIISSDFKDFKIPRPDAAAAGKASATDSKATPAPKDSYDPKNLSARDDATLVPADTSKATRESPVIVSQAAAASVAPARTTPAIIRTGGGGGSAPTREVPKLVADELSARLSTPTPAPPDLAEAKETKEPAKAKGGNMMGIIVAIVLLVGAGIGAVVVLGGGDSEEVEQPVVAPTKPADDSVGNLIKKADEKFVAGELIGDGGALSLLVAARVASPDDERVALRLGPLADKFQELGNASYEAGDIVEAAAHYKNSLEADPEREAVAQKLAAIEAEIATAEEGSK